MRKKTPRLLFILSLILIMLLIPLSAQASCGEYTTYNYGAILQMMQTNLGQYLSGNSCSQSGTAGETSVNSLPKQLDFFNLYDITRSYSANAAGSGNSCGINSGYGSACSGNSAYGGSCQNNGSYGGSCDSGYTGSTCNGNDCSGSTCSNNSCSGSSSSDNSCFGSTGSGSSCGNSGLKATYYTSANGQGSNQQGTGSSSPAVSVPTIVQQVVDLVNAERAKEGLAALTLDASLCNGAAIRVNEISTLFSHTRPNGQSCFTALDEAGVNYRQAGENIALGQTTAQQVMEDWMNSPGHRANIMSASYGRIGVAVTASGDSRYGGYAWAQEFAN